MIHCVVALAREARPLIDHHRLRGSRSVGGFRIYESDSLRLIVSGTGKAAAAAATAFLRARAGDGEDPSWINIGIAGHPERPVGTPLLAHRITDAGSGENYYPSIVFRPPCETGTVRTVDRPVEEYPDSSACEMEASGFFQTATRFSTAERIHCLKIVSDNPSEPVSRVSPGRVSELVEEHLGLIDGLLRTLATLAREVPRLPADPPGFAAIVERWRFSSTEKHRLRRLLHRVQVVSPEVEISPAGLESCRDAPAVLEALEERTAPGTP